ncbi:hypothetical protein APHAL10511_006306 [Amanita phalloides]|nr:hypothetical protein APHAL10511_006306 [Amanita phalloides]
MSATLNYNITWIEQTFRSRSVTETLLGPEHESGNITTNDYHLATRFLPGPHRYYRTFGGAGFPVLYAFRRPNWTLKTYAILLIGSITGSFIGHAVSVTKHYNFVRSLENPIGFSRALENVQHCVGGVLPSGPVIISRKPRVDDMEDASEPGAADVVKHDVKSEPKSSKPMSKWEQIRAMNASSAPTSSWDTIRQKEEKAQLSKSGVSVNHDREILPDSRPVDRAAQQAEFDAMLERERQGSSDDYNEVWYHR